MSGARGWTRTMHCSKALACLSVVAALGSTDAAAAGSQEAGFVAALASGAAFVALGIVDIATAPSSAREHNQRALGVAPWLDPDERRVGVAFSLDLATLGPGRATPSPSPLHVSATKEPKTAMLWSLGSTLIPTALGLGMATATGWNDEQGALTVGLVMAGGGWLVGPSVGHWYAGQTGRGLATTGVRLGIAAVGFLALTTVDFD